MKQYRIEFDYLGKSGVYRVLATSIAKARVSLLDILPQATITSVTEEESHG